VCVCITPNNLYSVNLLDSIGVMDVEGCYKTFLFSIMCRFIVRLLI
jgi:hypothetical protein